MLRPLLKARLQGACIGAGLVLLAWMLGGLPANTSDQGDAATETFAIKIERPTLRRCTTAPDAAFTGPTLSFRTCGEFAQERVSLMMGLTIGWLMNRSVVWPDVALHSPPALALPRLVAAPLTGAKAALPVHMKRHPPAYFRLEATKIAASPHVDLDCTFLALDAAPELEVARFMWHVHDALRPSPLVARYAAELQTGARSGSCSLAVVAVEDDAQWHTHCTAYDQRGACLANATRAATLLADSGVDGRHRVLLTNTRLGRARAFGDALKVAAAVAARQFIPNAALQVAAAAEYEAALSADVYIGHSALLASELVLLRRMDAWRPVVWHNGGGLPSLLPALRLLERRHAPLPWLVHFSQQAAQDNAQLLQLKRAVNSALERTAVRPLCLYDGAPDAVTEWLQARGVRVLYLSASSASAPAAAEALASPWPALLAALPSAERLDARTRAEWALLLTSLTLAWQAPALREEEALLVSSSAVLFRAPLTLAALAPSSAPLACAATDAAVPAGRLHPSFECDASVLLLRPSLMRGNELGAMVAWLQRQGADRPALVAALSAGFTNAIASLPAAWAWRPYWRGHDSDAAAVLFAGEGGAAAYDARRASPMTERCRAAHGACEHWLGVWEDVSPA